MDGEQFDALTRLWASRSRRGLLRSFAGAGLAGLALDTRMGTTEGRKKRKNHNKRKRCKGGKIRCGKRCVDAQTDASNCGTCGIECVSGQRCVTGTCTCGEESCSGCCAGKTCLSVGHGQSNQQCGVDGAECASCEQNERCDDGSCVCDSGFTACDGQCVDTETSGAHCGGCDTPCRDAACVRRTCEQGTCRQEAIPGCCQQDNDCDDGDPCTLDTCDLGTNTCQRAPVPECCRTSGDCDHRDPCRPQTCRTSDHTCVREQLADGATCGTSKICCNGECVGKESPSHCGACDNACGTGEVCVDDSCCTPLDGACRDNDECCRNSFCDSNRLVCTACTMCEETCCEPGSACEGARCCRAPGTGIDSRCGLDEHCCTGATCNTATQRCCYRSGAAATCSEDDQCCPGSVCDPDAAECCTPLDGACRDNREC